MTAPGPGAGAASGASSHAPGRSSPATGGATRARVIAWLRGVLVFSGLLPWALPIARARLPMGDLGVAIDLAFFTMCHRRPPRTLSIEGVPMPLCSRCAGIFLGVALAAAIGRPLLALRTWRWAFGVAAALMLADVVTQDLGLHPVWHPGRIFTGVLVGYLMVVGLLSGLARDKTSAADANAPAAP